MATNGIANNSEPVVSSSLPTLHLDQLRAGDSAESKKLLDACRNYGFFYLDLTTDATLCRYWEEMLPLMKQYFDQPLEVKMQDARGSDNTGYEPIGTEVGPNPATRDGYESLKISRREFLRNEIELSTPIRDRSDFFFGFMREAHEVTRIMLERLSDEMGLEGSSRFEAFHADARPTLTNMGLLKYPKHDDPTADTVGHNKHTDIGSLTFLLTRQWGLQVLSLDTKTWAFVKPRPNHAIINVGDGLHFTSERQIPSVVHRVIPLHGSQHEDRYSIAYFLRLNDDLVWTDRTGKVWSAKEWHDFKFNAFRSPDTMENGMQVVVGMMEENDHSRSPVGKPAVAA